MEDRMVVPECPTTLEETKNTTTAAVAATTGLSQEQSRRWEDQSTPTASTTVARNCDTPIVVGVNHRKKKQRGWDLSAFTQDVLGEAHSFSFSSSSSSSLLFWGSCMSTSGCAGPTTTSQLNHRHPTRHSGGGLLFLERKDVLSGTSIDGAACPSSSNAIGGRSIGSDERAVQFVAPLPVTIVPPRLYLMETDDDMSPTPPESRDASRRGGEMRSVSAGVVVGNNNGSSHHHPGGVTTHARSSSVGSISSLRTNTGFVSTGTLSSTDQWTKHHSVVPPTSSSLSSAAAQDHHRHEREGFDTAKAAPSGSLRRSFIKKPKGMTLVRDVAYYPAPPSGDEISFAHHPRGQSVNNNRGHGGGLGGDVVGSATTGAAPVSSTNGTRFGCNPVVGSMNSKVDTKPRPSSHHSFAGVPEFLVPPLSPSCYHGRTSRRTDETSASVSAASRQDGDMPSTRSMYGAPPFFEERRQDEENRSAERRRSAPPEVEDYTKTYRPNPRQLQLPPPPTPMMLDGNGPLLPSSPSSRKERTSFPVQERLAVGQRGSLFGRWPPPLPRVPTDLDYDPVGLPTCRIYRCRLPAYLRHPDMLDMVVDECDSYAETLPTGWKTELYSLTKQDIALRKVPHVYERSKPVAEYMKRAITILYGVGGPLSMDRNQPHILKYSAEEEVQEEEDCRVDRDDIIASTEYHDSNDCTSTPRRRSVRRSRPDTRHTGVELHHDKCSYTANLMLSRSSSYEGGGTYFPDIDKTIRLEYGEFLLHPGRLVHGGVDITKGRRYLMIIFANVK